MTETAYRGFYINLDRSTERRARMEAQLAALGLSANYTRFAATDGAALNGRGPLRAGEVGAFHSHTRALDEARKGSGAAHIIEDDAVLCEHTAPAIAGAVAAQFFDRFDILFTDMFVAPHLGLLKVLKTAFDRVLGQGTRALGFGDLQILDLAGQNFSCLTSYVVGPRALERVHALLRQELERGPTLPVDLFLRNCVLQGQLRAACAVPFVTSFDFDDIARSTIVEGVGARPSVAVLAALRYSFYAKRDLARANALMDAAIGTQRPDSHRALMARAAEFVLSDAFKEF
jgi:GR25 family glycosyltransferase involved in LPS biosynthesis